MITLIYDEYADDGIFGKLKFDEDDEVFCVTLSHAYQQADYSYQPIVLPGAYKCIRGIHKLENNIPFETFEILGVAGHSGLLFHPGNFNKDSKGCTLLGEIKVQSSTGKMITNSKKTFKKFMDRLENVDSFILEVQDGRVRIS